MRWLWWVSGRWQKPQGTGCCGTQNWFDSQRDWKGTVQKYFGHLSFLWVQCDLSNSGNSLLLVKLLQCSLKMSYFWLNY